VTIARSWVEYETERHSYRHVDCSGHADYMKQMIASRTQLSGAILVVSAVDGPKIQTREHLFLARQVGIEKIVVFLNKAELVRDRELLDLIEEEVRGLLHRCEFPGNDIPIIRGSALQAMEMDKGDFGIHSIGKLMEAIDVEMMALTTSAGKKQAFQASLKPHKKFQAFVYVLTKEEGGRHTPFFKGYRPQFSLGTTEGEGEIMLREDMEMVLPGDHVGVGIELVAPLALEKKDRFLLRERKQVVGVGVITEVME